VLFRVSLGHFVLVLLAFVVFDLVSSVFSQEIGWEERLRNQSINQSNLFATKQPHSLSLLGGC